MMIDSIAVQCDDEILSGVSLVNRSCRVVFQGVLYGNEGGGGVVSVLLVSIGAASMWKFRQLYPKQWESSTSQVVYFFKFAYRKFSDRVRDMSNSFFSNYSCTQCRKHFSMKDVATQVEEADITTVCKTEALEEDPKSVQAPETVSKQELEEINKPSHIQNLVASLQSWTFISPSKDTPGEAIDDGIAASEPLLNPQMTMEKTNSVSSIPCEEDLRVEEISLSDDEEQAGEDIYKQNEIKNTGSWFQSAKERLSFRSPR